MLPHDPQVWFNLYVWTYRLIFNNSWVVISRTPELFAAWAAATLIPQRDVRTDGKLKSCPLQKSVNTDVNLSWGSRFEVKTLWTQFQNCFSTDSPVQVRRDWWGTWPEVCGHDISPVSSGASSTSEVRHDVGDQVRLGLRPGPCSDPSSQPWVYP